VTSSPINRFSKNASAKEWWEWLTNRNPVYNTVDQLLPMFFEMFTVKLTIKCCIQNALHHQLTYKLHLKWERLFFFFCFHTDKRGRRRVLAYYCSYNSVVSLFMHNNVQTPDTHTELIAVKWSHPRDLNPLYLYFTSLTNFIKWNCLLLDTKSCNNCSSHFQHRPLLLIPVSMCIIHLVNGVCC
jgi:hypothetical protein